MIDCNVTENFLREKARMTEECRSCNGCILSSNGNCIADSADTVDDSIAIVQAWSDAHPQRTYLSALLEAFPKTEIGEDGTPCFCPNTIGFANRKEGCRGDAPRPDCWAQVIEE